MDSSLNIPSTVAQELFGILLHQPAIMHMQYQGVTVEGLEVNRAPNNHLNSLLNNHHHNSQLNNHHHNNQLNNHHHNSFLLKKLVALNHYLPNPPSSQLGRLPNPINRLHLNNHLVVLPVNNRITKEISRLRRPVEEEVNLYVKKPDFSLMSKIVRNSTDVLIGMEIKGNGSHCMNSPVEKEPFSTQL